MKAAKKGSDRKDSERWENLLNSFSILHYLIAQFHLSETNYHNMHQTQIFSTLSLTLSLFFVDSQCICNNIVYVCWCGYFVTPLQHSVVLCFVIMLWNFDFFFVFSFIFTRNSNMTYIKSIEIYSMLRLSSHHSKLYAIKNTQKREKKSPSSLLSSWDS